MITWKLNSLVYGNLNEKADKNRWGEDRNIEQSENKRPYVPCTNTQFKGNIDSVNR